MLSLSTNSSLSLFSYEQTIFRLFTSPFNHLGSYLVGVLIGFFLIKFPSAQISKELQTVAWVSSTSAIAVVIFLTHEAYKSKLPTLLESSLYYAFSRVIWSWSIGWIIFACSTGRGGYAGDFLSWSFFAPLSSLSYLAYLIHPLLIFYHTGRLRERIYFGHYEMVNIFLSRLFLSFFLAFLLFLLIEMPFAALEKVSRFPANYCAFFYCKKKKSAKVYVTKL